MLKKITALLLMCTLLVLFGCGSKPDDDVSDEFTLDENNKIALIIGSEESDPEVFAKARELRLRYGENLLVHGYGDECWNDLTKLGDLALKISADENVKAIVFARGVNGITQAVEEVHRYHSDVCLVVCNSVESLDGLVNADLVLNIDGQSVASSMLDSAKDAGAELFVMYTHNRLSNYYAFSEMRTRLETLSEEKGIALKVSGSVDVLGEGRSVETANTFIHEDVQRKLSENGKNVAAYSLDSTVQDALAKELTDAGMIVPATTEMSPFALARAYGISLTDHETDNKYCVEQVAAEVAKNKNTSRVFSWQFSEPMAALEVGLEFALSHCSVGEGESIDRDAEVRRIFSEVLGDIPYTLQNNESADAENQNAYLISGELYTY